MPLQDYTHYLTAKGYSEATTASMLKTTIKFITWMDEQDIEITQLTYNDLMAYVQLQKKRPIKARTLQIIITNLKHYLNYSVEANILSHNPALALTLKNTNHKTVYTILSPEELDIIYKSYPVELAAVPNGPPQTLNKLARKRNKILLGLLIYQGISAEDLKNIELNHLELREGKITIPATRRSHERTLMLQPHQIFNLYDYVNEVRKEILRLTEKQSNTLFISIGSSNRLQNMLQKLIDELKQKHPHVENLHQIRASVITNWLKQHNKRKVQYMAGHKYVSSTEAYEASNIEELQEDVQKYYPQY